MSIIQICSKKIPSTLSLIEICDSTPQPCLGKYTLIKTVLGDIPIHSLNVGI